MWTVLIFSAVQVFVVVQWRVRQGAWQAVTKPDRSLASFVYARWRNWAQTLEPAGTRLMVALPINEPLAAFVRTPKERRVELRHLNDLPATAERAVQSLDGWLIVPVNYFSGREEGVEKRTWILNGDEQSQFSVAAYRRLQ